MKFWDVFSISIWLINGLTLDMTSDNLIIFQKTYDFVLYIYPVINRIPKSHRMVLGKHLEDSCLLVLLLVIKANKTREENRKILQMEISDKLDSIRILVRLAKDLKFLSINQYTLLSEKLNEIGKMTYCWSKT